MGNLGTGWYLDYPKRKRRKKMKSFKRIIAMLLAGCCLMTSAACGGGGTDEGISNSKEELETFMTVSYTHLYAKRGGNGSLRAGTGGGQ